MVLRGLRGASIVPHYSEVSNSAYIFSSRVEIVASSENVFHDFNFLQFLETSGGIDMIPDRKKCSHSYKQRKYSSKLKISLANYSTTQHDFQTITKLHFANES